MFIFAVLAIYLLVTIFMALTRKEATNVVVCLAIGWTVVASWITVSALRGDLASDSWTANHAHSAATAYVPFIALSAGLAIGTVLCGWTVNPPHHSDAERENKAILIIAIGVVPILAILGTAVAFGICMGLIQPVDGLPASVIHDFGITHNVTSVDPGWAPFQHEVRMSFLHTVFSATAIGMALLAFAGGGLFGFVAGKFIEPRR